MSISVVRTKKLKYLVGRSKKGAVNMGGERINLDVVGRKFLSSLKRLPKSGEFWMSREEDIEALKELMSDMKEALRKSDWKTFVDRYEKFNNLYADIIDLVRSREWVPAEAVKKLEEYKKTYDMVLYKHIKAKHIKPEIVIEAIEALRKVGFTPEVGV